MDIRNFFKKPKLMDIQQPTSHTNERDVQQNIYEATDCMISSTGALSQTEIETASKVPLPVALSSVEPKSVIMVTQSYASQELSKEDKNKSEIQVYDNINAFDIGNFLGQYVSDEVRFKVLTEPWIPEKHYDFKKDSMTTRVFRTQWLKDYPCIAYSAIKKGVFCRPCVLFRPRVERGLQGSFIVKEFTRYKDFHDCIRQHIKSKWHNEATLDANNFCDAMRNKTIDVAHQINTAAQKLVESNREKVFPIIKTIVFCGVHGLPLRGKDDDHSIFKNLLNFRIDSGDTILKNHFETSPMNAKYV